MFHFFRQIRQRLLTDNKFSKYLLFAIGEISLVVIGILIALQVDNWNEQRKEEDFYRNYLVRLKTDYEEKLNMLEEVETMSNELVSLTNYLTDFLNGELNSLDTLKLAVSMEKSSGMNKYYLSIPTYSELSSTGRLAIIANDSLKNILNAWHEYGKYREGLQAESSAWIAKYRDLIRNILVTEDKMLINHSWWRPYPDDALWDSFNLETSGPKITKELSEKPDILGLLNDILIFRTVDQYLLKRDKKECLETIELIESELNRLTR